MSEPKRDDRPPASTMPATRSGPVTAGEGAGVGAGVRSTAPTCSIRDMPEDDFDTAWIDDFAAAAGVETLDDAQIEALLTLAGVAAHDSGDRRNAPISCFLRGLQLGRAGTEPSLEAISGDRG